MSATTRKRDVVKLICFSNQKREEGVETDMESTKEIICIIDIENKQKEYARCLKFIELMNNYRCLSSENKKELDLLLAKMKLQIADGVKNRSPRYLEEPITIFNRKEQEVFGKSTTLHKNPFNVKEIDDECSKTMHYHVRIHLKKTKDAIETDYRRV